jgi:GNAT superfamily N-acetyltransferase
VTSGEIAIRPAAVDDAAAIAAVQVASWHTTYRGLIADEAIDALSVEARTARWREILGREGCAAFVAQADGAVVGFAEGGSNRATEPPFSAFSGELNALYLLATHQRGGTGTRLVRAFAAALLRLGHPSMIVWVLENNPARAFYEALGGRLAGAARIDIDGVGYSDVAYGWDDLKELLRRLEA